MNGFFISLDRKEVAATNGYILAVAPLKVVDEDSKTNLARSFSAGEGWICGPVKRSLPNREGSFIIDTDNHRIEVPVRDLKPDHRPLTFKPFLNYPSYCRTINNPHTMKAKDAANLCLCADYVNRPFKWAGYTGTDTPVRFEVEERAALVKLVPLKVLTSLNYYVMRYKGGVGAKPINTETLQLVAKRSGGSTG